MRVDAGRLGQVVDEGGISTRSPLVKTSVGPGVPPLKPKVRATTRLPSAFRISCSTTSAVGVTRLTPSASAVGRSVVPFGVSGVTSSEPWPIGPGAASGDWNEPAAGRLQLTNARRQRGRAGLRGNIHLEGEGPQRGAGGQVVEDGRYCLEIVQQINALSSAARAVALVVLEDHLRSCVEAATGGDEGEAAIREMLRVLRKALRQ